MKLSTPVRLLGAAAILGMLPLAASQLGAVPQFNPDQTDRDIRALEQEVAQLRNLVVQVHTANNDLRTKLMLLEGKIAPLETGIGRTARDFTIGGGEANQTITMKMGRFSPASIGINNKDVLLNGKDLVISADTIDLRGKVVRISATTAISVNGGTVDIGGSTVNVKGSKDSVVKGSKVLGN